MMTMKMINTTATRPNFDINATEGENDEVDFAIETPAGPFGFGSGVKLDNTQVGWSSNFVLVSILLLAMSNEVVVVLVIECLYLFLNLSLFLPFNSD